MAIAATEKTKTEAGPDIENASSNSSSTAVDSNYQASTKSQAVAASSGKNARWRGWVPFVTYHPIAPPPRASLDDAPVIPLASANVFSILTFQWMQPMLSLGQKRPLEATDLWKMDGSREVAHLADQLIEHFERRLVEAEEWNKKIKSGEIKPNFYQKHVSWPMLTKLGIQRKDGQYQAGLFMALNDVFGYQFWTAGFIKVAADAGCCYFLP